MNAIIIILFNFLIGTLCLITGVNFLSSGLENANPSLLKKVLTRYTGKLPLAFITGTATTAILQSSTAVTIITVGFVNSGLMRLTQAVGIIYGANIGTTITAQLMAFRITEAGLPIIVAGAVIGFFAKSKPAKSICKAIMGSGLMFLGLGVLHSGVPFVKESKFVYDIFVKYGGNPYIGLLIGMITTMLVQSSSATVGLTIVLFNTGLISFDAAIGLTLGDNIGTCATAQIASLRANIWGRRTAWAHTFYNIIGAVIALVLLTPFSNLVRFITLLLGQNDTRLVANTHTIFNILSAAVFLPLTKYYVRFIKWLVPE
jgi:phosphate:Na+ symporter